MNRFNLPDINFLEKAPEDIERDILFYIEENAGLTLSNADPRRKFIQSLVLYIVQERNNLDYVLKQNLLAYAEDEFLDFKGEELTTSRLQASSAVTTMKFHLEEGRVDSLIIPKGTRFIVGNIFFATNETVVVAVGQQSIEVLATCTEEGTIGNGYLPGEITNLVDPLPWVRSVSNITISNGGTESETNDAYAERIRLAPEKFSVAGSEDAYIYWAKTASQEIIDVVVLSTEDAKIDIRVLLKKGELPSPELLEKVLSICSGKTRRPLTDKVIASGPEQVLYNAVIQYWINEDKVSMLKIIQEKVEQAFQDYLIWQKEKMGRDVDLTELIKVLKDAGANRVAISSDMYKKIEKHQVAKENEVLLTFGGLADG